MAAFVTQTPPSLSSTWVVGVPGYKIASPNAAVEKTETVAVEASAPL
jgi:hypothetical protein